MSALRFLTLALLAVFFFETWFFKPRVGHHLASISRKRWQISRLMLYRQRH